MLSKILEKILNYLTYIFELNIPYFGADLKMEKIILASVIVFHFLKPEAEDTPLNSDPFVKSEIVSLVNLQPSGKYQTVKDFGDAPSVYGSADHVIDNINYIGSVVDEESSDQPSPSADADDKNGTDDEDGVIFPALTPGAKVIIPVTLSGSAFLNAWIDWNGDGDFADPGERIVNDSSRGNGTFDLSVNVPSNAITSSPTFARFRFGPKSSAKPAYNSSGSAGYGEVEDYQINIKCNPPSAPIIGTITQATCLLSTGSVILNGLPSTGKWTITRTPGGSVNTGSGTSTTIAGLEADTYTFTVTNASGCTSGSSANAVINVQPATPGIPVQTVDCSLGTGKAVVTVTSPLGAGLEYRLDAGVYQTGTVFTAVANGNHAITVRNSSGCSSMGNSFSVSCGCINSPTVTLSSIAGNTCGGTSLIVNGNVFGGSATNVTITENGSGTVSPSQASSSPFSFAYTPAVQDAGKSVIITVTSNNPLGTPCAEAVVSYTLSVNAIPIPPKTGIISQPTCNVSTGSVALSDLPDGTWALTINPGGTISTGSGANTVVSDLTAGIHSFTVTSLTGCTSSASASVVIDTQPKIPAAPMAGSITQPDCFVSTGSVDLNGLPSTGNWILTRYPGIFTLSGTGSGTTISDLPPGIYNFSVTNADLCTSITSANVVISNPPAVPTPPVAGSIVQPTCTVPAGRVELTGLPSTGTWTLTRAPDEVNSSGTGTSTIVTDLSQGIYFFTVINSVGCISLPSESVIINHGPATAPTLKVSNPKPGCYPVTMNLTDASITTGSSPGLVYTYWRDSKATMPYNTPATATDGTYYIKGTTSEGCFDIKPVIVKVFPVSIAAAGPDQDLDYVFGTVLEASDPGIYETGIWSVGSGTAEFVDTAYARTSVSGLSIGENKLLWTVTNGICSPSKDSVTITVHNLLITTLITPNGDSNNEYFIIKGIEALGKSELKIFDRSGKQLYINKNYNNRWNGVDFNGDPLPSGTYFFGLKTQKGEYIKGYIVVRYNAEK